MAEPTISIITVCRNAASTIEETLRSVREQDYPHIEHIVIDGASTDGTVELIRQHEDGITYWISEPDQGIADAMNKGIANSKIESSLHQRGNLAPIERIQVSYENHTDQWRIN